MAEGFWEEISELKKAMSDVYGDWDSGESKAVIKGLGNVDDLQHIQEEVVEVEEKVGKTVSDFKVRRFHISFGEDLM